LSQKDVTEKSSSAPPVKSTTTGGHRKEQYAAARARREEGHDHQINLLRTASGEYSGLQLAQKKRKKKSCESRELTSADRP